MTKKQGRSVVVTDTHRGIYWGYLDKILEGGNAVRLIGARHACRYRCTSADNEGMYGLATVGPDSGSKIGPRVTMTIRDVSKIIDCSDAATEAWEAAKWVR